MGMDMWRKLGGGRAWYDILQRLQVYHEARTRSNSVGVFIISQVPSSSTNDLGKGYPVNEWLCYLSAHSFTLVLRYLSLLFLWMVDQVRAVSTGYK